VALRIVPYTAVERPAVLAFNERMRAGHAPTEFVLPEDLPRTSTNPQASIRWTDYIVMDGEFARGGVLEMNQPGWVGGRAERTINYQSPLSEGILDPTHSMVAMQLVRFMQRRSPYVFIVGMGSETNPLPRLLKASGWHVEAAPFYFRVRHAGAFLRELRILRRSAVKRIGAQLAAATGMGAIGLKFLQRRPGARGWSIERVTTWGDWADSIWESYRDVVSFAVVRDRKTLQELYPAENPRHWVFLIRRGGQPVAWSVGLLTPMQDHKYFGDLKVATILDAAGATEDFRTIVTVTDRALGDAGADLVVANHTHADWLRAFRASGFLAGPSNYIVGLSKQLAAVVDGMERVHVTRGDGDGRINL
jgi:hypothetical protein